MEKMICTKKPVKLSETDRRVLLEYSSSTFNESGLKITPEAAINKNIHKLSLKLS